MVHALLPGTSKAFTLLVPLHAGRTRSCPSAGHTTNYTDCICVPKKAERRIFSTLRARNVIFLTSLDKAASTEENDTKIIKVWLSDF